ncbi:hypothetical protein SLU01_19550 [Sporosarcina luteola]|uniref:DUF4145 domain-containing protein n=1 Tax=Sporosarcina luteola TaxID=582850 RepID=A0A511Z884_9BACL|nr:DUF4145 domain-containing protein [Sporosarcina luteola]GEN83643.1 hypothetical protein SLU01_19550 [Sporosarcina luteola]
MSDKKIGQKLYCRMCKQETNHKYIYKHSRSNLDFGEWDYQWFEDYFITQCLGCDTNAFLREYGAEDMQEMDEFEQLVNYTKKYVYPEKPIAPSVKNELLHPAKDFENAPESIAELYKQLVSTLNSRHYLLCAVGLRMIVEAVCKETGVTEGIIYDDLGEKRYDKHGDELIRSNLEGKINGLQTKGFIVEKQAKTLHQIRHLGNVSAHELEIPKRSTIIDGIEIIENMIINIFELDKYQLM